MQVFQFPKILYQAKWFKNLLAAYWLVLSKRSLSQLQILCLLWKSQLFLKELREYLQYLFPNKVAHDIQKLLCNTDLSGYHRWDGKETLLHTGMQTLANADITHSTLSGYQASCAAGCSPVLQPHHDGHGLGTFPCAGTRQGFLVFNCQCNSNPYRLFNLAQWAGSSEKEPGLKSFQFRKRIIELS